MSALSEPTPPVRWGDPRWRYGVGLVTIVLGATATNLTSTYSLWFLYLGPLVQLLGWLVLPGALWRRILVTLPCLLAALVLLAGPDFIGAFAVLLGGWLFARHRPMVSYLALLPVILLSFVVKAALNEYSENWIGLVGGAVTCVLCAWLGRELAVWRGRHRTVRQGRRNASARSRLATSAPGPMEAFVPSPSGSDHRPHQPE
jgi:hypothetical protein